MSRALPLQPLPVLRPWGGRRIARRFGWPDTGPCGEWWLASTHPGATTALAGADVDLAAWLEGPGQSMGCPRARQFPLLLKFLDADERLSLQVHPNDQVAARAGLPRGKTEAWHVLDAERGAAAYLGAAPGHSAREIVERAAQGAGEQEVLSLLGRREVAPGDTLLVEAGMVHALDGGIALFEVQQNSDTTYRIYDWGRGRPVHLREAAEAVVDHPPRDPMKGTPQPDTWQTLAECAAFTLRRARPASELALRPAGAFGLLTVLQGRGQLVDAERRHTLRAGDTLLLVGETRLAGDGLDVLLVEPQP